MGFRPRDRPGPHGSTRKSERGVIKTGTSWDLSKARSLADALVRQLDLGPSRNRPTRASKNEGTGDKPAQRATACNPGGSARRPEYHRRQARAAGDSETTCYRYCLRREWPAVARCAGSEGRATLSTQGCADLPWATCFYPLRGLLQQVCRPLLRAPDRRLNHRESHF